MLLLLAIIACAAIVYAIVATSAPSAVHKKFGLNPSQWTLISTDLGSGQARRRIYGFGIGGEPDAVFRGNKTGQLVVGEYKSRSHKGYVRRREYYQVILYIGLARETYRSTNVIGLLAYKDARVEIEHNESLFRALIAMRGEVIESVKRRKPLNNTPLHKRISIESGNRKIRFPRRS